MSRDGINRFGAFLGQSQIEVFRTSGIRVAGHHHRALRISGQHHPDLAQFFAGGRFDGGLIGIEEHLAGELNLQLGFRFLYGQFLAGLFQFEFLLSHIELRFLHRKLLALGRFEFGFLEFEFFLLNLQLLRSDGRLRLGEQIRSRGGPGEDGCGSDEGERCGFHTGKSHLPR